MAIELPGPVVSFLSIIGVDWPNVNEDRVRDFASHVREFASAVDTTHQQATATVKQLGAHYQGASYEPLVEAVGQAAGGLMFKATEDALGVSTDGWEPGDGFSIDPAMLKIHAQTMHGHADTVAGHAKTLQTKLAGVSFQ